MNVRKASGSAMADGELAPEEPTSDEADQSVFEFLELPHHCFNKRKPITYSHDRAPRTVRYLRQTSAIKGGASSSFGSGTQDIK